MLAMGRVMDNTDRAKYKPRPDVRALCPVHHSPMSVDPAVWGDATKGQITPFYNCDVAHCELQWGQRHGYFVLGTGGILHSNEDPGKLPQCSTRGHGYLFIETHNLRAKTEVWACSVAECDVKSERNGEPVPAGWECKCQTG
jgi:hypothetical protein